MFTLVEPLSDRRRQITADDDVWAFRRILVTHVHDTDRRKRTIENAALERRDGVLPRDGVLIRLHGRSGGSKHHESVLATAPHDGDVAAVIPRCLLLLVRAIVLFIDDDQANLRQRREDGRTRADDDIDLSAVNPVPLIVALAVRQSAVLNGHARTERAAKERRHSRRQ